jgi:hypothetical protein
MGACWAKCQELDADEVFAYNTVKLVRVKDRYLGILRLLMLLGIFLYIFVFVLIVQQKYLELEDPVGTCNTSLMFQGPVNVSSFPYCTQYTGPHPAVFRHPCVVWDDSQVRGCTLWRAQSNATRPSAHALVRAPGQIPCRPAQQVPRARKKKLACRSCAMRGGRSALLMLSRSLLQSLHHHASEH